MDPHGYFEDPTPAMQVQTLPPKGPKILRVGKYTSLSVWIVSNPTPKKNIQISKKSPTGPTEQTPKPEYLIALAPSLGVRWEGSIQFLMEDSTLASRRVFPVKLSSLTNGLDLSWFPSNLLTRPAYKGGPKKASYK